VLNLPKYEHQYRQGVTFGQDQGQTTRHPWRKETKMASKQLDALVRKGLIGTLKYEMNMLTPLLKQQELGKAVKAGHVEKLREAIGLAWKAHRSRLSKVEKARFGIT
jgi:hypothetical protein